MAASNLFAEQKSYTKYRVQHCKRADGRVSREDTRPNGHKLTQFEEDSLTERILSMDSRGAAPKPSTVRDMANILLAARGEIPPATVGKNGPSTFVQRRDELGDEARLSRVTARRKHICSRRRIPHTPCLSIPFILCHQSYSTHQLTQLVRHQTKSHTNLII